MWGQAGSSPVPQQGSHCSVSRARGSHEQHGDGGAGKGHHGARGQGQGGTGREGQGWGGGKKRQNTSRDAPCTVHEEGAPSPGDSRDRALSLSKQGGLSRPLVPNSLLPWGSRCPPLQPLPQIPAPGGCQG